VSNVPPYYLDDAQATPPICCALQYLVTDTRSDGFGEMKAFSEKAIHPTLDCLLKSLIHLFSSKDNIGDSVLTADASLAYVFLGFSLVVECLLTGPQRSDVCCSTFVPASSYVSHSLRFLALASTALRFYARHFAFLPYPNLTPVTAPNPPPTRPPSKPSPTNPYQS
jgi:hypothetical protein